MIRLVVMHYYIVILEIWRQIAGLAQRENIPYRAGPDVGRLMALFSMRSAAGAIRKEQQTFPDAVDNRSSADGALGSDTLVELAATLGGPGPIPTPAAELRHPGHKGCSSPGWRRARGRGRAVGAGRRGERGGCDEEWEGWGGQRRSLRRREQAPTPTRVTHQSDLAAGGD